MGRVVAWAPNPRYGLSPRRLTGPAFALDSCRSKPSLGTLLELLEKDVKARRIGPSCTL